MRYLRYTCVRVRADETTIVFERAGDERHETLSPARGGQPKDNYPLVVVIIVYLTDPCGVAGKASSMFFPAGERVTRTCNDVVNRSSSNV